MQAADSNDQNMGRRSVPPWVVKVILGLALLAVLLYGLLLLGSVWILLFASVLFAIVLDAAASLLRERVFRNWPTRHQTLWVLVVVVLSIGLLGTLGYLFGPRIADQFIRLAEAVPNALDGLNQMVSEHPRLAAALPDGTDLKRQFQPGSELSQSLLKGFSSFMGALAAVGMVLIVGFYLALNPQDYVRGGLLLVPKRHQAVGEKTLHALGHALRRWLLGRLLSMFAVFVLTSLALWLLGSPLALSLGLLAGLLTFIPFIGPIVSAVPAVLLGFMDSGMQALWIALVYVGVQFLEGNLITPVIQSYAVSLRPALLLIAQLVVGSLFGLGGVIVATPLGVAVVVLIQVLYVQHKLDREVQVLGEPDASSD